jgi:hypothetical protein
MFDLADLSAAKVAHEGRLQQVAMDGLARLAAAGQPTVAVHLRMQLGDRLGQLGNRLKAATRHPTMPQT